MVLFLSLGGVVLAQEPDREKIRSLKVAFITERLSLTTAEAQKFWPIYNTYEDKKEQIWDWERSVYFGQMRRIDELSESESSKLLKEVMAHQEEKNKLDENLVKDLKKVISDKKILLLRQAEQDFKRKLLRQFRKKPKDR